MRVDAERNRGRIVEAAQAAFAGRGLDVPLEDVADLPAALKRIDDVAFPYELAQVRARMGVDTILAKILVIEAEWQPGRTTVVLVREPVGI